MPSIGFNLNDSFAFLQNKNSPLTLDFALSLDLTICRRLLRVLELLRHTRKPALAEVKLDLLELHN